MIDETKIIHTQVYDDEHEEWIDKEMTIAEYLDAYTDEGCPEPCREAVNIHDVIDRVWEKISNGEVERTFNSWDVRDWFVDLPRIKFAEDVVKEMDKRGTISVPEYCVTGEKYEEWLYDKESRMTNEEAIERIKDHMVIHKMNEPRAVLISEALEMAIEALKAEPCDDCRKAEEIMQTLCDYGCEMKIQDAISQVLETKCTKCEDAVSRADIKKIAKEMYLEVGNMELDVHTISDCISYTASKCRQVLVDKLNILPPVTPKQKWIPVDYDKYPETYPKAFQEVWMSDGYGEVIHKAYDGTRSIKAWMPYVTPEPYKEGESE